MISKLQAGLPGNCGGKVKSHSPALLILNFCAAGSIFLFATSIAPAESTPGALPATRQFEVPPQQNTFKLEEIRRLAQENTELHRLKLTLPAAAFDDARPLMPAQLVSEADAALLKPGATSVFLLKLGGFFLGFVIWFLIARKFSPELLEYFTGWLRLRARELSPRVSAKQLVTLLAEEKAVAEFQAALQGGTVSAEGGEGETASEGREGFQASAAGHLTELRRLLSDAGRTEDAVQHRYVLEALDRVHQLKNLAKPAEFLPLRQMASGMEMLVKQLSEKSANITSSTLRTTRQGVELMEELCRPGLKAGLLSDPPLRLLVVDDETFSRFALANSLKRGLADPDVAVDGRSALALANKNSYDLIVLDVQMPGMDGFELCSKIHELEANRTTPVIFVTSMRDFEARANSILCGGRDLIAKPFLTFELTVKALTLVASERLHGRGRSTDIRPVPSENSQVVATEVSTPIPSAPEGKSVAPAQAPAAAAPKRLPLVPTTVPLNAKRNAPKPAADFLGQGREQIEKVQKLVELATITPDQGAREEMITDMFLGVHSLAANASAAGQPSIALTATAVEGLLKKLLQDSSKLTISSLDTIAAAAELIHELCVTPSDPHLATAPPISALAVDDDPIALRAVINALQMTLPKPQQAADGKTALSLASKQRFDVVFLDVQMPDIDGFEVCGRLRQDTLNQQTPIIFLTSHEATGLREQFASSGGTSFITKPCLASELNLKALVHAVRGRLGKHPASAAQAPAELACA